MLGHNGRYMVQQILDGQLGIGISSKDFDCHRNVSQRRRMLGMTKGTFETEKGRLNESLSRNRTKTIRDELGGTIGAV
jgi:hypothetical protein